MVFTGFFLGVSFDLELGPSSELHRLLALSLSLFISLSLSLSRARAILTPGRLGMLSTRNAVCPVCQLEWVLSSSTCLLDRVDCFWWAALQRQGCLPARKLSVGLHNTNNLFVEGVRSPAVANSFLLNTLEPYTFTVSARTTSGSAQKQQLERQHVHT